MGKYIMGIDVGTTGSKAMVFDDCGKPVGSGYKEYTCEYPHPNWVEQDAAMLRSAVFEVAGLALKKSGVAKEEIAAVSVSAQRCCALFIDENGEPLKMISWMDNRPGDEVTLIDEKIGALEFYKITGMPLCTTWILPKLLWVRKNEPELWNKSTRIVQLHDFILKSLGAPEYYSNEAEAAFWGLWDTDKLCWSDELFNCFSLDKKVFPEVKVSGTPIGKISKQAADAIGLSTDTVLCIGGGDQNCAAIGAGVVRPGTASVSLGTGGLATVFAEKPFRDPTANTMVTNSAAHGNWQIEGLQNGAAGVFRWFRDELAIKDKCDAEAEGVDAYVRLNELIARSPAGAKGLVFLPYLASAASPRYNQSARGALIGLTFQHDRGDIARAVIEGITLEQKDILTSMRNAGVSVERIRIIGGATKSDLWNQLQADCYGCPVETLKVTDAALMGSALCASVGAGWFKSIPEASDALVHADKTYMPDEKAVSFYDASYEMYCMGYDGLDGSGLFKAIAERQKA